jgi:hypothetical protein
LGLWKEEKGDDARVSPLWGSQQKDVSATRLQGLRAAKSSGLRLLAPRITHNQALSWRFECRGRGKEGETDRWLVSLVEGAMDAQLEDVDGFLNAPFDGRNLSAVVTAERKQ